MREDNDPNKKKQRKRLIPRRDVDQTLGMQNAIEYGIAFRDLGCCYVIL